MNAINFKVGEAYTFVLVSDAGTTIRREILITRSHQDQHMYKVRNRKDQANLPPTEILEDYFIFKGHDLPFVLDSETASFQGNAQFNFVTDQPEYLRTLLIGSCLNPSDHNLAMVTYRSPNPTDDCTPLFPELIEEEERD